MMLGGIIDLGVIESAHVKVYRCRIQVLSHNPKRLKQQIMVCSY